MRHRFCFEAGACEVQHWARHMRGSQGAREHGGAASTGAAVRRMWSEARAHTQSRSQVDHALNVLSRQRSDAAFFPEVGCEWWLWGVYTGLAAKLGSCRR